MNTKFCPHCRQIKSTDEFYTSSHQSGGFRVYCKKCTLEMKKLDKEKHPLKYKKWSRTTHQRLKRLVLTHYGGGKLACVRCSFDDLRALTLDHIDGDGAMERRGLSSHQQGGYGFFRLLRDRGFPKGYQTLCMNCQWIKRDENEEYGIH